MGLGERLLRDELYSCCHLHGPYVFWRGKRPSIYNVSPLLQAQHANSLNACCKLSCIFPQPTFEKHRSYGPVLQEGFYPGKSRVCTIK